MQLANRVNRLGTETAFAVAQAAAEWESQGNRVYPFHLGDIDIPTAPNIVEAMTAAVADGKTGYCPGPGISSLREALADNIGEQRGMVLSPGNVVVTTGGKPVITKFLQAVMNRGDSVLYPNPGFPIYESQIEYFGGLPLAYGYTPTDSGFAIDLDYLRSRITPRTTAIIYNDLQNPLSAESSAAEREEVAQIAREHDLWVLSDEAYFETRYEGVSQSIAALDHMAERTVILYTFSKKYAMTGWRLGCAVAPRQVAEVIGRMNTNDESCTTHFVQHAGVEALRGPQASVTDMLQILRSRRDLTFDLVNAIPGMTVALPESTFYLFPDVTDTMARVGVNEVSTFADLALTNTGVSFCTREHFGTRLSGEDRHYIRLAYAGIDERSIQEGLNRLREWVETF